MRASIRLDGEGSPYLIVYYDDMEGDGDDAKDDAERLFFTKLNQNGGLLHLVPGKGKQMRMLVTTGLLKRKANVTESSILGGPAAREQLERDVEYALNRLDASNHEPLIKESRAEDPSPKYDLSDDSVLPLPTGE